MKHPLLTASVVGLLSLSCQLYGQTPKAIINFLAIPGPIIVQKQAYQLTWSAHPDASLYKQEYLTAGDAFPHYKSLVTVDFVVTESTVAQAVSSKLRDLESLKQTNPIMQVEVMRNATTGEVLIDCLIGNNAADEQANLVERDVFRFKAARAKSGQRGILLLAVSNRKYGPAITPYLTRLKADKSLLVNEVAKLAMPTISITN